LEKIRFAVGTGVKGQEWSSFFGRGFVKFGLGTLYKTKKEAEEALILAKQYCSDNDIMSEFKESLYVYEMTVF